MRGPAGSRSLLSGLSAGLWAAGCWAWALLGSTWCWSWCVLVLVLANWQNGLWTATPLGFGSGFSALCSLTPWAPVSGWCSGTGCWALSTE